MPLGVQAGPASIEVSARRCPRAVPALASLSVSGSSSPCPLPAAPTCELETRPHRLRKPVSPSSASFSSPGSFSGLGTLGGAGWEGGNTGLESNAWVERKGRCADPSPGPRGLAGGAEGAQPRPEQPPERSEVEGTLVLPVDLYSQDGAPINAVPSCAGREAPSYLW